MSGPGRSCTSCWGRMLNWGSGDLGLSPRSAPNLLGDLRRACCCLLEGLSFSVFQMGRCGPPPRRLLEEEGV